MPYDFTPETELPEDAPTFTVDLDHYNFPGLYNKVLKSMKAGEICEVITQKDLSRLHTNFPHPAIGLD